jgi:ATP-dependent Lon protease
VTAQFVPSPQQRLLQIISLARGSRSARTATHSHREFPEGGRGVSYDMLFGAYLTGATRIVVKDPYIQQFHQARNMMELLETIVRHRTDDRKIAVHLVTSQSEPEFTDKQLTFLGSMAVMAPTEGICFSWEFAPRLHDRSIETNTGWKIILGRGLDIFQWYDVNNAFDFQNRLQSCRRVRGFSVTYLRNS